MPTPELLKQLKEQVLKLDREIADAEKEIALARKAKIDTPQLGANLQRLKERVALIKAAYGL